MTSTYLDHAASTPTRPEALAALQRWLTPDGDGGEHVGNASSAHAAGRRAREAVEVAREQIARIIEAHPQDIVFTSGGTESDNLAVKGLAWAAAEEGRKHIVTTQIEHPAVLDTVRWLVEHQGFTATFVEPHEEGWVDIDRVLGAVTPETGVVSVMMANNELGAVNDIARLGERMQRYPAYLHTDAVQAFATINIDVGEGHIDALSLSAHKFGGPQGVGIAYVRRGVPIVPLTHGGGQDRGVRSGTFAAALNAACGEAVVAAALDRPTLGPRLRVMSRRLWLALTEIDGVRLNGPPDLAFRLPSHVHLSIDGVDGEALTFALDQAGLLVSAGAACSSGANKASHVLEAVGVAGDAALRLSSGWTTTDDDIDRAIEVVTETIHRLRAVGGGGVS